MAITPERETAPYVGESPTTPQKLAGWRIEPPVSDAKAPKAMCAATAAADPPEDPPATRVVSCGFLVTPNAEFSVDDPMANSSRLVLPKNTASLLLSFLITPAS